MINLDEIKNIHMIGIGGIGVSALSRLFLTAGKKVSGSDMSESKIIKELRKKGISISIGHSAKNLSKNTDLLVYTPAVGEKNPELVRAKELNIPTLTYPQALGLISKNYYLIAVAGTHGKTTTTAMSAKVLVDLGVDPTVVVGSLLNEQKTNYLKGKSKYLVIEACEYKRSFLSFNPNILIITNIDLDHLDYYKDLKDIQSAFIELTSKLSKNDYLICDVSHKNLKPILDVAKCQVIDYKKNNKENLDLKIPGEYNIENAQSVLALSNILKLDTQKVIKSLNDFSGTWRRFEYKGKLDNKIKIYDDYAHNPTEVFVTLKGIRDFFPDKKIVVIFQPHLYSRTKIFLNEFAFSFNEVNNIIVLPIYASREPFDSAINSEMLVEKIKENNKNVVFAKDFDSVINEIKKIKNADIIITMGAGDVYKIGEKLLKNNVL